MEATQGVLSFLAEILGAQPWRAQAKCRGVGPERFYPVKGSDAGAKAAKEFCADCPVQEPCLEFALRVSDRHGIWGGATERDRRTIVRIWRTGGAA